jgi:hypothetical protein
MAVGIVGLRQLQIGKETTLGTAVACTTFLRMEGSIKDESKPEYPKEDLGYIRGVGRSFVAKEDGTIEIKGTPCTFEQLPYFGNMTLSGVTGVQDGAGTGYVYTQPFPTNSILTPYTYTIRHGDNQQAELVTAVFCEELTIKGEAEKPWTIDAKLRGWPRGTTTFTGSLTIPTVEEVIFGLSGLYIDAPGGTIGTTQITDGFRGFELKISKVFQPRWQGNLANKYYTRLVMNSEPEITLKIKLDHDSSAVAERAARRALTHRLVRIKAEGSTLGTAGTYTKKTILLDCVGSYMEPEPYDDDDGVTSLEFSMGTHYNATAALGGRIVTVRESSTLP